MIAISSPVCRIRCATPPSDSPPTSQARIANARRCRRLTHSRQTEARSNWPASGCRRPGADTKRRSCRIVCRD